MKLFLVAAIEGVGSMRETLRIAECEPAIRRFLGFGLTERLGSHATVSYAQCVRFASGSSFEQLFTQVLARCREAGLLDGRRLVVDAAHVEADAALKSLRAELSVIDGGGESASAEASAGVRACRAAIRTPSCVTSLANGRIWCTARRSRPIRGRA